MDALVASGDISDPQIDADGSISFIWAHDPTERDVWYCRPGIVNGVPVTLCDLGAGSWIWTSWDQFEPVIG